LPAIDIRDQYEIMKLFKIRGFEYGNWVNQEQRFNFLVSAVIAFQDLNNILKFKNNIGFDKNIGIAFGARGQSGAAAHFEPDTFMINLTKNSGIGSFAHEYGHAIDYFFGTYIDQSRVFRSLTFGRSTSQHFEFNQYKKGGLRYMACNIVFNIIYTNKGQISKSYERLKKFKSGDYWFRHNEIFARAFEQYIHYKLDKLNIKNTFLTKYKYDSDSYLFQEDMKRIIPIFDELIFGLQKYARGI